MDILSLFNFGGFSIECPLKLFSLLIGATIKGKNKLRMESIFFSFNSTVKPILSGHSKKTKIGFQDRLSLNTGQKYCRILLH